MTREEIKEYILTHPEGHLQKARKKGFVCPLCNNGTGKDGDGLVPDRTGTHYHCFHCGFHGDLIELIAQENGIADGGSREAFEAARAAYGLTLDTPKPADFKKLAPPAPKSKEPEPDYTAFYKEAAAHLGDTAAIEYLKRRGISEATARRFNLGYVAKWRHEKVSGNIPFTPRLIIPVTRGSYMARDTRQNIPAEGEKFKKMQTGHKATFNRAALQERGPCFVAEGEISALSILEAGRPAVAISSAERAEAFLEELEQQRPAGPLVLCLDKDPAGEKATAKLEAGLKRLGLLYITRTEEICGEVNDPNDAIIADRAVFCAAIEKAYADAWEKDEERKAYLSSTVGDQLQGFIERITKKDPPIPVKDWPQFTALLEGGFYAGLYTVGSISSLGKTTWALQLADNFIKQGRDVLYFSMEMSADELTAKNVSRLTWKLEVTRGHGARSDRAKSTLGILDHSRYKHYSPEEMELIQAAIEQHQRDTMGRFWIFEGVGDYGVQKIAETVEKHITFTGRYPIVFIDYLQILAPEDIRASDKQNTDRAVLALKRLSRKHNLTIIAISSMNRDNYTEPVNMAAFKESGAIEFGSDVLIGLQYEGMDYRDGEKKDERATRISKLRTEQGAKWRSGDPQDIEVKILKNRNGPKDVTQRMAYYSVFNIYQEKPPEGRPERGA